MNGSSSLSEANATSPRVLIVGCGGIGGVVAAHLFRAGADATVLTRHAELATALAMRGLVIRGAEDFQSGPGRACTTLDPNLPPFDFVILATQPPDVESAARSVAPHLAEDGALVCLQNGLCETRLEPIVGASRVIGGVVAWGATSIEPGVCDRTSRGGFTIGGLDGRIDARLERLAALLRPIGPVRTTDNLLGARWSKLAINCAISSLGTVGGDRLGPLLRHRFVRRLGLEIMTETVAVAQAAGVTLEPLNGTLDLGGLALSMAERRSRAGTPSLVAKHVALLAVGVRYRRLRSSMLQAIERGRASAVDFLNGEVVARGESHAVATPVNRAVCDAIHRIARGQDRPGLDALRALYRSTRDAVTTRGGDR